MLATIAGLIIVLLMVVDQSVTCLTTSGGYSTCIAMEVNIALIGIVAGVLVATYARSSRACHAGQPDRGHVIFIYVLTTVVAVDYGTS